jgi:hypothetical protein
MSDRARLLPFESEKPTLEHYTIRLPFNIPGFGVVIVTAADWPPGTNPNDVNASVVCPITGAVLAFTLLTPSGDSVLPLPPSLPPDRPGSGPPSRQSA